MNKRQKLFFLSLILLLSFFLRFYRIEERVTFLGDQGRDLLEIRKALMNGKIPLAGPLSNEGVHSGPAYYYLIIPSLIIAQFNPLGPILFTSFLGVMTTFLLYYWLKKVYGFWPAFFSAALYATSPLVIKRTLGIWNPIPIPFFTILILVILDKIQEERQLNWLPLLGLLTAFSLQLYLPAYFLFLPILGWWLSFLIKKSGADKKRFLKWSLFCTALFFLCFLPFLIFQFQNNFTDWANLLLNFLEKFMLRVDPLTARQESFLIVLMKLFSQQFKALLPLGPDFFWLGLGLLVLILPYLIKKVNFWQIFFSLWFLAGIVFLTLFPSGAVHSHYASFLWVLPFLFLASFLKIMVKFLSKKILIISMVILVGINLSLYRQNFSITDDLSRTKLITDLIIEKAENKSFSLLLLSQATPSDAHLRYFLMLKGAHLEDIEESDSLFLICDQENCPQKEELKNLKLVNSFCLPVCPRLDEQRKIDLSDWHLLSQKTFWRTRQVYFLERQSEK